MADDVEEKTTRKKGHEPISVVCAVIILIATVAVAGAFIADNVIGDSDHHIDDGDKVTVSYTLSFYDYYNSSDGTPGVIFQTTDSAINDQHGSDGTSYLFANTYSFLTSNLEVTINAGKVLQGFNDALLGHKAGDTVYVTIPASGGYTSVDTVRESVLSETKTVSLTQTVSAAAFADEYGFTPAGTVTITTSFGWDATATFDSMSNTVTVVSTPTVGESYTSVDNGYGKVVVTVSSVDANNVLYTTAVSEYTETGATVTYNSAEYKEIEMIELKNIAGNSIFVYAVQEDADGNATAFLYKTVAENYDIDLYFVIHIESIEEA